MKGNILLGKEGAECARSDRHFNCCINLICVQGKYDSKYDCPVPSNACVCKLNSTQSAAAAVL